MRQSLRFTLTFGALMAVGPFAINMYLPSLPTLQRTFDATPTEVQLTLAVYFIGMALGQMPYGTLADRWGRRPPMLLGMIIFTVASVGCALADSVFALAGWRFLQALGGCSVMVVVRAIIRDLFSPLEGARVFSTLLLVMGVAPIIGPLVGGWVLVGLGWRAIFWSLTIYGVASVLTIWFAFPETRKPAAGANKPRDPLLTQLRLLMTDRVFVGNSLAGGLSQTTMFAYIAGSPYVFIEYFGVAPESYGWLFGINAFGLIAASQLNRVLLSRLGLESVLMITSAIGAVAGVILLAVAITGVGGLAGIMLPLFFCVAVMGFVFPNTSAAAMASHPERAGLASGVLGTMQFAMGAIASFLVGALHAQSAIPLAAIICVTTVSGVLARRIIVPRGHAGKPARQRH